jgi:hypothetical protein
MLATRLVFAVTKPFEARREEPSLGALSALQGGDSCVFAQTCSVKRLGAS